MPGKYIHAEAPTYEQMQMLITDNHPELSQAGVKIDLLFAFAPESEQGEAKGPALKVGGYPALAVCSITALKNRVMGRGDAEIILDGDIWDKLSKECQDAIIDHELEHLVVCRNLEGGLRRDTHGRPRLKMRLHDIQFGAFLAVASRHGEFSQEIIQARKMIEEGGQAVFSFLDEPKERRSRKKT